MAEIEIGVLSRQCLYRRVRNRQILESEVDPWQQARKTEQRTIEWNFTLRDPDQNMGHKDVPKHTGCCVVSRCQVISILTF